MSVVYFLITLDVQQHEVLYSENLDLETIPTPVNPDVFEQLLIEMGYPDDITKFVIDGFRHGFSLGYQSKVKVQLNSLNLKLNVGDELELWNKVIKEVKLGHYAGPFDKIPEEFTDDYIQSPIRLVPKDDGKNTRLIFHLSYPRTTADGSPSPSVNANTPKDVCLVKYPDFNDAIQICLKEGHLCYVLKSDFRSAFRNLGMLRIHYRYLIMKA